MEEPTGMVILTLRGPLHTSGGTILEDAPVKETRGLHRGGTGARSVGSNRVEGQRSSNPGASTPAMAAADANDK